MSLRRHSIQAEFSVRLLFVVSGCMIFTLITDCSATYTTLPSLIDDHLLLRRDVSPYVAYDDVVITRRAKLTIEAGCEIHFAKGKQLHVYGTLDARGTLSDRIVFTKLGAEAASSDSNGQEKHLSDTEIYNSDVYMNRRFRLVEGDTILDGKLQIFVKSKWHYVCSTQFK
jgi:hypothetical protein